MLEKLPPFLCVERKHIAGQDMKMILSSLPLQDPIKMGNIITYTHKQGEKKMPALFLSLSLSLSLSRSLSLSLSLALSLSVSHSLSRRSTYSFFFQINNTDSLRAITTI